MASINEILRREAESEAHREYVDLISYIASHPIGGYLRVKGTESNIHDLSDLNAVVCNRDEIIKDRANSIETDKCTEILNKIQKRWFEFWK